MCSISGIPFLEIRCSLSHMPSCLLMDCAATARTETALRTSHLRDMNVVVKDLTSNQFNGVLNDAASRTMLCGHVRCKQQLLTSGWWEEVGVPLTPMRNAEVADVCTSNRDVFEHFLFLVSWPFENWPIEKRSSKNGHARNSVQAWYYNPFCFPVSQTSVRDMTHHTKTKSTNWADEPSSTISDKSHRIDSLAGKKSGAEVRTAEIKQIPVILHKRAATATRKRHR